jgi:hypothetical protein
MNFFPETSQAGRQLLASKKLSGLRLEGHQHARHTERFCLRTQGLNQRPVTTMHAVEIAHSQHAAAMAWPKVMKSVDDFLSRL